MDRSDPQYQLFFLNVNLQIPHDQEEELDDDEFSNDGDNIDDGDSAAGLQNTSILCKLFFNYFEYLLI